jgi:bromodomain-containing factor 1
MPNLGEMVNGNREGEYTTKDLFPGPAVDSPQPANELTPPSTERPVNPATSMNPKGVESVSHQPNNNSESVSLPQQPTPTLPTTATTNTSITVNTDVEMKDASSSFVQPSKPVHEPPPADEPPAKRFKTESSSISQQSSDSGKKLPANQQKFLSALLRQVKKARDARPFLEPVDPIKLNIPRYFDIIVKPMDLGTMEQKLSRGAYGTAQEFIDDFNLMIDNCVKFNGPENPVTKMAKNIQATFEKGIKSLPPEAVRPSTSASLI